MPQTTCNNCGAEVYRSEKHTDEGAEVYCSEACAAARRRPSTATPDAMRAALLAVKALWDKHGLGDEDAESEPVYAQLCAALK